MTRRLTIEPEAEADIIAAADWYQRHSFVLRDRFRHELARTITLIASNSEQYQIVEDDIRRASLHRFPYIVYRLTPTEINIAACLHGRRDPTLWRTRLREFP